NMLVIKFAGIDSREDAEAARGQEIFVTEADLPPLEEGEFYIRDLIGMEVVEAGGTVGTKATPAGDDAPGTVGRVADVMQNTAQDLLEVKTPDGRKVLIPWVDAFVREIDIEDRRITVRLPKGLMDL
ncbi:MAG: ribosome maturation factor RimM, partial [Bacillota bacterium]|nr:ribosome maturation factor RimM [Bacillota bacterium]